MLKIFNYFILITSFFQLIILSQVSPEKQITFCIKSRQCTQINDFTFQDIWKNRLSHKLNEIQRVNIFELTLSEQNYIRLLSHPFPHIRQLIFYDHDELNSRKRADIRSILTPKIVQTIFLSNYFSRLETLDMIKTSLDFRHFIFLNNTTKILRTNLKKLLLTDNYLEKKGFELLSRIQFNNLQELILAQNSLYQPESIDSIIKIIKPHPHNLSTIKNLSIGSTSITTDNAIRLLDSIDTSKLQSLNICQNAFQQSISYKIPFNYTFYEYLSTKNFSSLKRLIINSLDLDQELLPYLKKLKIPLIKIIDLQRNFITDDYFTEWITSQSMPHLQSLSLSSNDLTDNGVESIVNWGFKNLTNLDLTNNRRLSIKQFDILKRIDSNKWKQLKFSFNALTDKSMREFFKNRSFQKIQSIVIQNQNHIYNIMSYLDWKSMKNLKYINLIQSQFIEGIQEIILSNITFPELKKIDFGGMWITQQNIIDMINCLKSFAPNLGLINIISNPTIIKIAMVNISALEFDKVTDDVYIQTNQMKFRKPFNSSKFEFISLIIGEQFFKRNFHFSIFGFTTDFQMSDVLKNDFHLQKAVNYIKKIASFDNLQHFTYKSYDYFKFFQKLVQNNAFGLIKGSNTYMPYLVSILYQPKFNVSKIYGDFLLSIDAPMINRIEVSGDVENSKQDFLNKVMKKHKNTVQLYIYSNSLNCSRFNILFQGIHLPFLMKLDAKFNRLEYECLKKFIQKHQTLKSLHVSNNFFEKNLFDKIIQQNELILPQLQISNIQIGNQEYRKLAHINRLFLENFQSDRVNINTEGIKLLIKQLNGSRLFTKISSLSLKSNNINDEGVNLLLSTGIPSVQKLQFSSMQNPNIINTFLSYPNRLVRMDANNINIYGLRLDLDPRSTRNLQNIGMRSSGMSVKDYEILSKTQLNNLRRVLMITENVYECESLKYLIKIFQHAEIIDVVINNQKKKGKVLNDDCLAKINDYPKVFNHLKVIIIRFAGEPAYIPTFFQYFYYQDQQIQALVMDNDLIGDQTLLHIISKCDLKRMLLVSLINNLLSDNSMSVFLSLQIPMVTHFLISRNLFTSAALKPLINKTYQNLINLELGMNNINDTGIDYLVQAKMIHLETLSLDNTQITIKGIMKIFKVMELTQLRQISLYSVYLTQKDLVYMVKNMPFQRLPFLTQIRTTVKVSRRFESQLNIVIKKRTKQPFKLLMDVYNVEQKNVARIS